MIKKAFLCFLSLITAYCSLHGQHTLTGKTYESFENGGLCSTIISMLSDSVYLNNHGCEGYGSTFYGKYYIKADTLFLKRGIVDPALKIITIDSAEMNSGNLVELCFIDQHGNNLSRYFKATFKRSNNLIYSLSYDSIKNVLYYPKISDEEIKINTLILLGIKTNRIKTHMSRAMSYTYYLHIPDFIRQLNLFNENILSEGPITTLHIKPGQLIEYVTESPAFYMIPNDGKIIYRESPARR